MTDLDKALQLRAEVLKAAPSDLLKRYPNKWDAALVMAKHLNRDSRQVTKEEILKYWHQGCYSSYIAYMFDISVEEVHQRLVEYDMHAPYYDDTSYNMDTINSVIAACRGTEYSASISSDRSIVNALKDAVKATYPDERDMYLVPILRPGAPEEIEILAIKNLYEDGTPLQQIARLSRRTDAEIAYILRNAGVKVVNDMRIERAFYEGKWISFIARMFDISIDETKRRLRAMGLIIPQVSHGEFGLQELNDIAEGRDTKSELSTFYIRETIDAGRDLVPRYLDTASSITQEEVETIRKMMGSGYTLQMVSRMCGRPETVISAFMKEV